MAGVELKVEYSGDGRLRRALMRAERELGDPSDLMNGLAQLMEGQVKRRIADEKTTPGGKPWEPWSDEYAKTRHGGNSLLMGGGDLKDTIAGHNTDQTAVVGSELIYAPRHQFGFDPDDEMAYTPPRPFLGISDDNRSEIVVAINDFLRKALR